MSIARYRLLAAEIRDAITRGEYPPGHRLPPINVLATERQMGRNTVSAAYSLLEAEGLVSITQRGPDPGIVVADRRPVSLRFSRYSGAMTPDSSAGPWERAAAAAGVPGEMRLIDVDTVPADPRTAALLELPAAGRRVVCRIRHALAGDPLLVLQLHTAAYPARLVRDTPLAGEGKVIGGVYGALLAAGITPATATETIRYRPATDPEAAELRLRGPASVLTLERITRDPAGKPIELLDITADPTRTELVYDTLPLTPP
jgi:GntR family transcriptional regulator